MKKVPSPELRRSCPSARLRSSMSIFDPYHLTIWPHPSRTAIFRCSIRRCSPSARRTRDSSRKGSPLARALQILPRPPCVPEPCLIEEIEVAVRPSRVNQAGGRIDKELKARDLIPSHGAISIRVLSGSRQISARTPEPARPAGRRVVFSLPKDDPEPGQAPVASSTLALAVPKGHPLIKLKSSGCAT